MASSLSPARGGGRAETPLGHGVCPDGDALFGCRVPLGCGAARLEQEAPG